MKDRPIIRECLCAHPFQDERYGKGKRLMNPTMKEEGKEQLFRCTVCLREWREKEST